MRLMQSLLFGVSPVDLLTYVAINGGIFATSCILAGCFRAGRRRSNPSMRCGLSEA